MSYPGMSPILAEFDGKCAGCGEMIVADADHIVRDEDGNWVHDGCEE